jgi:lipopolysaccharide transport system ATP-binding protein
MSLPVVFDDVSKKFRRGEWHDSLRDLLPEMFGAAFGRRRAADRLAVQEFWALRNVSFEVDRGSALGIVGPNGAGKSTTLKLLTRILKPTTGRSVVHGRVGALIEVAAGFHPDLTGRENVFLQGAIMGMKRTEIAERFDEMVDFAGVGDFIDTPVKRYSSGMNARLGFSIAAHLRPDVLIIDEVLSVGDAAFQQRCFDRIQEFVQNGVAVVLVSHNLTAVSRLCPRSLLLGRGKVIQLGPTSEVLRTYASSLTTEADSLVTADVRIQTRFPDRPSAGVWIVEPGTSIRLSVELECLSQVHKGAVGVVVWDLARQLYVYGVMATAIGIAPITGGPGTTVHTEFEFVANLARGTYIIEVNCFDVARQRTLGTLKPAAQFTVVEQTTYDGIANLFFKARAVEPVRA